ncbi:MAG: response regulator [Phycisphaerales bacterium]|nr:response regulator [Phycisphaerales bacterium]
MTRILVAEDDPHILRVISLWLTRQGYEVIEARNGEVAIQLYDERRPDIIITDINMPVMDGLALLDTVFSRPRLPRGIVVLTNRWDHREIGQRLEDSGVITVPKPFSPTKLAELIQTIDARPAAKPEGGIRT